MLSSQPDQHGSCLAERDRLLPEKEYFTLRAQQQLALIYLRKGDWDRAMSIFEKLASLNLDAPNPKIEAELKAFGLAGQ